MKTIQYGWKGVWQNMGGHGCSSQAAMEAYVARVNEREGYGHMRVSEASTEGEAGAPPAPIFQRIPMTEEVAIEFLEILARQHEGVATEADAARLREIDRERRGPVIGYEEV